MPSDQFQRIFPPRGRQTLDGGLNNNFDKALIENNESADCLNVIFDKGGAETREGFTKANSASVGTFACDGLYTRHDNSGAQTMVAWFNGTLYQYGVNTFSTVPSAQSIYTAGVRVGMTEYENYAFFGNGGSIPYKWNGAQFTRHGIYAPSSAPTAATNSAGTLTGDYRYRVTFVNSGLVESDVGPATSTLTLASQEAVLTGLPVAPTSFGVESRRIYRTDAGTAVFKRLTEIADNTTTTYVDNISDSALGVTAPTDQGVPPNWQSAVYHQGRLFMTDSAEPNLVWYTEIANPYVVPSTNFRRIGDVSGEIVRGLKVYSNGVVVITDGSPWIIYTPTADDADWLDIRTKSPYGSKSPFGLFLVGNQMMYPAMQNDKFVGFAALSGDALAQSATFLTVLTIGSDLKSERIEPDMFLVQEAYAKNISAIVFKNRAYVTLTYGSGQTTNNRVYAFDFSKSNLSNRQIESWAPWSGMNAAQFTVYNGNLYFGSSTAIGQVYQMFSGSYSDDGTAINSYLWTKEFSGLEGDEEYEKDIRWISLLSELPGAYNMDLSYRVDSDQGDGNKTQIDVTPGGSLWGTMVWGRDPWSAGFQFKEQKIFLGGLRGKRVQFRFSNQNTLNQKFKILGIKFSYNNKGKR